MARKSKAEKLKESSVHEAMQKALIGIQVNVMDLGKMSREIESAYDAGKNLNLVASEVAAKYAVKGA